MDISFESGMEPVCEWMDICLGCGGTSIWVDQYLLGWDETSMWVDGYLLGGGMEPTTCIDFNMYFFFYMVYTFTGMIGVMSRLQFTFFNSILICNTGNLYQWLELYNPFRVAT